MNASTINRRVFLALAPAAAASHALASTPLASSKLPALRTKLFLVPGGDEYKTCFGADYQAGVKRIWRLLLAHGVPVEVKNCLDAQNIGSIFPVLYIYADYLPASLAPELRAWQQASPRRSITLSRVDFWTDLDTPEKLAAVCRL